MIKCFLLRIKCLLLVSVFSIGQTQYIKKAPQFFSAFNCVIGYQSSPTSGPYPCVTPNVIPRTDKYGLSSVELTKAASVPTSQFSARLVPDSIINTTSFTLTISVFSSDNVYFDFILVAIGHQPQNTWVDMFQHSLINDIFNTLSPWVATPRTLPRNYVISTQTIFTNTSNLNYAVFISSYLLDAMSTGYMTNVQFSANNLSSSQVEVKLSVPGSVSLRMFQGFVLVYNTNNMATDGAVYVLDYFTITETQDIDFQLKYPDWGARFNTKCIIGYWYINYYPLQDFQIFFKTSPQLNYNGLQDLGFGPGNDTLFKATIFCLSNGALQCDQNAAFYDSFTQGCYLGPNCPISTTDPGIFPTAPQLCQLCNDIECIDCQALNRGYCLECNSTFLSLAVNGLCECITGYYRPPGSVCVYNCTYQVQGCKISNCTNQTCCNQCMVGYHLFNIVSCSNCKACSSSITNCSQCSDQILCTKCQPQFYLSPIDATRSVCDFCNLTIPYCYLCTTSMSVVNCNQCYPGYINSIVSCNCSTINLTGCASCNIPTQCVTCRPAFYLHPATKQCQLCTTLFQCLTCSGYNNCTTCNQLYIPYFNVTQFTNLCLSCGIVFSNCYNCSSLLYCDQCDTSYGVDSSGYCQSCSALHAHCALCTDHTICSQCELNSYTFFINSTCITCSEVVTLCSTCAPSGNQLICTQCLPGYFLNPVTQICYLCSQFIDDCFLCQFNSATAKPQCTECTAKFLVDATFTCQKCKQGNYVTRTCSNVTGCSSSHVINGITTCLSCDAASFFQYDKSVKKCVCQTGFHLQISCQLCQQVCGDGLTTNMECDDGNKINGDGCSDQCTVEDKFECTTSLTDPTTCILNEDISIVYDYTLRHMGENKLSMYFTVSPIYTALNKVDWKKAITFNFSEPINSQFTYQDGILIITMEYTSDLEGKLLDLVIDFDPSVVNSGSQSLSLTMGAVNGPLTYESESNMAHYKVFNTAGLVVGVVCLMFYLVSSYFHKMIGLQTIQFIQLVYFVRLISGSGVSSSFYAFNTLKYSNGYNDIFSTSTNSAEDFKSIPSSFIKLNLKLFFLQNCNLMLIPVALASLAYLFYTIKKSRSRSLYNQTKEKIHKDHMVIQNRKLEWIYDSLIFSFTLSLLYLIYFSMLLQDLSVMQTKSLYSSTFMMLSYAASLTVLFFVSAIYCQEVISGIKKYKQMTENNENVRNDEKSLEHDANGSDHGVHPLYVSFYLVYQLILIVLLSLVVFVKFNFLIEAVLGLTGSYLAVIVVWKPYKGRIHNNAIIGHQAVIIGFILFQLMSKYKLISGVISSVFLYMVLSSIILALSVQLIRLYLHKKLSNNKQFQEKKGENEQNNVSEKQLRNKKKLAINPYSFQNEMKAIGLENIREKYNFFPNEQMFFKMPIKHLITNKLGKATFTHNKSVKDSQSHLNAEESFDSIEEFQLKKQRMRQQLNILYEASIIKTSHIQ